MTDSIIEQETQNAVVHPAIERLRESKREFEQSEKMAGETQGRAWAETGADYGGLCRLSELDIRSLAEPYRGCSSPSGKRKSNVVPMLGQKIPRSPAQP